MCTESLRNWFVCPHPPHPTPKQACGRFINNNAVTKMVQSSSKSPELLARYCDSLLKKSSKNPEEAELEDTLNQVVSCSTTCKE